MFKNIRINYRDILSNDYQILDLARVRLLTFLLTGFILQRICMIVLLSLHAASEFVWRSVFILIILIIDLLALLIPFSWKAAVHVLLLILMYL